MTAVRKRFAALCDRGCSAKDLSYLEALVERLVEVHGLPVPQVIAFPQAEICVTWDMGDHYPVFSAQDGDVCLVDVRHPEAPPELETLKDQEWPLSWVLKDDAARVAAWFQAGARGRDDD